LFNLLANFNKYSYQAILNPLFYVFENKKTTYRHRIKFINLYQQKKRKDKGYSAFKEQGISNILEQQLSSSTSLDLSFSNQQL